MGQYGYQELGGSPLGDISAVVTSLPAGPQLGDERVHNGIKYRLVYNAGGASGPVGSVMSPVPLAGGAYSVTVTTASDSRNHVGAVVVVHNTATTGAYFWGAYQGTVTLIPSATISAGKFCMVGATGKVTSAPSLPTETVGNRGNILVVTSGNTAGAATMTGYVSFVS